MNSINTTKQSGAVSLFVVIFAMLIITVVTVSFIRIMIADQQQASDSDLSQSAYDSAQAGVEDAKRAILRYQELCRGASPTDADCNALAATISSDTCNLAVLEGGVVSGQSGGTDANPGEILVQQSQSSNDTALNQAYTCVTIDLNTPNYEGSLSANQSKLVPLIGTTAFDTVTVRWFSKENITNSDGAINLGTETSPRPLLNQASWPQNRPSVMRTQLIQFGSSFTLQDFDIENGSGELNAATLFLYPTADGSATNSDSFAARDSRKTSTTDEPDADLANNSPMPVRCEPSVTSVLYACSMSLRLPTPIEGGTRTAYLRLTSLYNASDFDVILTQGGIPGNPGVTDVDFKNVQPQVDSTGRANDLFRRVQSRVDLTDTGFPYPDAAVDVTNNFCKTFSVTDRAADYDPGSCTP